MTRSVPGLPVVSSQVKVFICSFVFMNFLACVWYYVATIEGLEKSWLTNVGKSTMA